MQAPMRLTVFAQSGIADTLRRWADAFKAAGVPTGMVSLDAGGGEPEGEYNWDSICAFDDHHRPKQADEHRRRGARIAGYVEHCVRTHPPDVAIVWGNATTPQRATAAACKARGVPVVFAELGWFPQYQTGARTTVWDCIGFKETPHELSDEVWNKRLLHPEDVALDEYVGWWKRTRASKHPQNPEGLPEEVGASEKPILLVLLQVDWDTALFYTEGLRTQEEVMAAVRSAAGARWQIVVKEHPAAARNAEPGNAEIWTKKANLHDCLQAADCVVTANSNAGLEAMLYEKPVVCLAEAPYSGLGFTWDCRDAEGLERMLERTEWAKPPHLKSVFLRSFLHYVIFRYCFAESEAEALAEKIARHVLHGDHAA